MNRQIWMHEKANGLLTCEYKDIVTNVRKDGWMKEWRDG